MRVDQVFNPFAGDRAWLSCKQPVSAGDRPFGRRGSALTGHAAPGIGEPRSGVWMPEDPRGLQEDPQERLTNWKTHLATRETSSFIHLAYQVIGKGDSLPSCKHLSGTSALLSPTGTGTRSSR